MTHRTTTVFDTYGRAHATIDGVGNRTTTVFDSLGRVSEQIDEYSNRTTFLYDAYGRQETTIDFLNNRTTAVYDSYGRQHATINTLGNITTTVFDAFGRVSEQIDQLGNRTTFLYDAFGRQETVIDVLGNRATTVYDAFGRVSAQINQLSQITTFLYDAFGRQEAVKDALNNLTTTVYDEFGRHQATINPLTYRTTTVYDEYGRVSAQVNQLNQRTTFLYDANGRQETVIDPLGNRTTAVFDSIGRQHATIDALNKRTTTVFDTYGRVSAQIDQLGKFTTFLYDSHGRQETVIDPTGERTTAVFDSYGRQHATIDQLGNITTSVYDNQGRVEATIDSLTHRTTTVFDTYGRAHATIDGVGNRTTTVFDAYGRQQNLIDASNNKTTFVYDALNREIQRIDPSGLSVTYAYDAIGRQNSTTDRLGRRRDFGFDAGSRKTTETWIATDGSTVQNRITFTYDNANRTLTAADSDGAYTFTYDAKGQVATAADLWGNLLTFTYNARGQRTKVEDTESGVTDSVYDDKGQLTRRDFSDGVTALRIDFTYNDRGQIEHITRYGNLAGTFTAATTSLTYSGAGALANHLSKDGSNNTRLHITFTYDAARRLTAQNDGTPVTYSYDNANQVTADGTTTVLYDPTGNRTTVVNGSGTFTYTTATGNKLSTDGVWNYTYDAEGNMTKKILIADGSAWKYSYDHWNHLIEARKLTEDPDTYGTAVLQLDADYKYDALGNRIEKAVDPDGVGATGTTTMRYAVDGWNPAKPAAIGQENFDTWGTFNTSGDLTRRFLEGDGVDEHLARIEGSNAYWYLTDHLNSIRSVLNSSGAAVDEIDYDAFGNITSETSSANRGLYAYTGRELDVETQLQFNRARYYDAATGRWISQDPLGFDAGDSNLYRYVKNETTTSTDPNGLEIFAGERDRQKLVDLQQWLLDGTGPMAKMSYFGNAKLGLKTDIYQALDGRFFLDLADRSGLQEAIEKTNFNRHSKIPSSARHMLMALNSTSNHIEIGWEKNASERDHSHAYYDVETPGWWTYNTAATTLSKWEKSALDFVRGRPTYDLRQTVFPFSQNGSPIWRRGDPAPTGTLAPNSLRLSLNAPQTDLYFHGFDKRGQALWSRLAPTTNQSDWMEKVAVAADLTINTLVDTGLKITEKLAHTVISNEFQQMVRFAGGLAQTIGGLTMMICTPEPTMLSKGAGLLIALHGIDTMVAAMRSFDSGENKNTLTHQLAANAAAGLGASPEGQQIVGVLFDAGIPIALGQASSLSELASALQASARLSRTAGATSGLPSIATLRNGAIGIQRCAPSSAIGSGRVPQRVSLPASNSRGVLREWPSSPGRAHILLNGSGTTQCFAAGTKLLTPDGIKAIEDIRFGDKVLSRSEFSESGPVEPKDVEACFQSMGLIWHLHVNGKVIRTSGEHPFFVHGRGWVEACKLRPGDLLSSHDYQWIAVEEVLATECTEKLYNVRVADYHTYFVSDENWCFSIWAHNVCTAGDVRRAIGGSLGNSRTVIDSIDDVVRAINRRGGATRYQVRDLLRQVPGVPTTGPTALEIADELLGTAPTHHVVSRFLNNSRNWFRNWTQLSQRILDDAGISLEAAVNKFVLPGHQGPHPQLYHQRVFERLDRASRIRGGAPLTGQALTDAIANELDDIGLDLIADPSKLSGVGL